CCCVTASPARYRESCWNARRGLSSRCSSVSSRGEASLPLPRPMPRTPAHPLAEHPLDALRGKPRCSLPASHPTWLTILMLENSLQQCSSFVKGKVLDLGCGHRPYEKTFLAGATRYIGADYLSDRSCPDVI